MSRQDVTSCTPSDCSTEPDRIAKEMNDERVLTKARLDGKHAGSYGSDTLSPSTSTASRATARWRRRDDGPLEGMPGSLDEWGDTVTGDPADSQVCLC